MTSESTQEARVRGGEVGKFVDACLLSVDDSKAVDHGRINMGCPFHRQFEARRILLGGLTRVKPKILKETRIAGSQLREGGPHSVSAHSRQEWHGESRQLFGPLGHGSKAQVGVPGTFWPPEVATQNDRGTPLCEPLECGKKSSNPAVIGDFLPVQGNIGVHAQEDHTTMKVERAAESGERHYLELGRHVRGQVNQAVRVTPLVVIPGADFHLVADDPNETAIHNRGIGVSHNVARDDGFLGVAQNTLVGTLV